MADDGSARCSTPAGTRLEWRLSPVSLPAMSELSGFRLQTAISLGPDFSPANHSTLNRSVWTGDDENRCHRASPPSTVERTSSTGDPSTRAWTAISPLGAPYREIPSTHSVCRSATSKDCSDPDDERLVRASPSMRPSSSTASAPSTDETDAIAAGTDIPWMGRCCRLASAAPGRSSDEVSRCKKLEDWSANGPFIETTGRFDCASSSWRAWAS